MIFYQLNVTIPTGPPAVTPSIKRAKLHFCKADGGIRSST